MHSALDEIMSNMQNKEKKKTTSQRMHLKIKEHRIWKINEVNTLILKWISFSMLLINFFVLKIGLGRGKVSGDSQQFLSKALQNVADAKPSLEIQGSPLKKVWL